MVDKRPGKVATGRKPLSTVNSNTCVPSNGGNTYACLLSKGKAEVVDDFININDEPLVFNSKSKDKIKSSRLIIGLSQTKASKSGKDSANSLLQSRCKQTARKGPRGPASGGLRAPVRCSAPRASRTLRSRLATLNVCVWDDETWMVVRQWMQEEHIDALATQEARPTSPALGPVSGDELFELCLNRSWDPLGGARVGWRQEVLVGFKKKPGLTELALRRLPKPRGSPQCLWTQRVDHWNCTPSTRRATEMCLSGH